MNSQIVAQSEENKQEAQPQKSLGLYNPSKLPTYIGLFAKDSCLDRVHDYIVDAVKKLAQIYKNDDPIVKTYEELSNKVHTNLEPIKDLHVTTLFIGGNGKVKSSEPFTTFQPGYKTNVNIVALAVVPGKLVTGICFPDQSVIKIDNKFPHVTLMKGGWAPKFSNDLIEALCGKGGPLQKEYYNRGFETDQEFFHKDVVKVSKGSATAYVIRTIPDLTLSMNAESR